MPWILYFRRGRRYWVVQVLDDRTHAIIVRDYHNATRRPPENDSDWWHIAPTRPGESGMETLSRLYAKAA